MQANNTCCLTDFIRAIHFLIEAIIQIEPIFSFLIIKLYSMWPIFTLKMHHVTLARSKSTNNDAHYHQTAVNSCRNATRKATRTHSTPTPSLPETDAFTLRLLRILPLLIAMQKHPKSSIAYILAASTVGLASFFRGTLARMAKNNLFILGLQPPTFQFDACTKKHPKNTEQTIET